MLRQQLSFKIGDVHWINYGSVCQAKIVRVIQSHGASLLQIKIKTAEWMPFWMGMKRTMTLDEFWSFVVKGD